MRIGNLHTNRTWQETLLDLRDCFRKWGIEEYMLPTMKEARSKGAVSIYFAVNGQWSYPRCQEFATPEQNIRAIFMALDAVRKADQRGIGAIMAEAVKHLALPDPDDDAVILGCPPGTTNPLTLHAGYRQKSKDTHPDNGGDPEAFRRVQEAATRLGVR
tara:strand:- start:90 stop:566 length:477 start_codon:yes stop_codon:yes gene_type:complete